MTSVAIKVPSNTYETQFGASKSPGPRSLSAVWPNFEAQACALL